MHGDRLGASELYQDQYQYQDEYEQVQGTVTKPWFMGYAPTQLFQPLP